MNENQVRKAIAKLPLGSLRFFKQTGSTNDVALAWAADGAPDLCLVCAEEQVAGRGRGTRQWFTPPGAALAFSLILRPGKREAASLSRFSGLGALAVCEALEGLGLSPQVKWPNDVLLGRRKVCGVLAEAVWLGEELDCIILGIGMNVTPPSVPPADKLAFPAACVEAEMGKPVNRPRLLAAILRSLLRWRGLVAGASFLQAWERRLAFRGEPVEILGENLPRRSGVVDGLEPDGSLRLLTDSGESLAVAFGEVHLRPLV